MLPGSFEVLPETLASEPPTIMLGGFASFCRLLVLHLFLLLACVVGLLSWPLYLVLRGCCGRPPITPTWRQFWRYFSRLLREQPPAPGLSRGKRYAALLNLLRAYMLAPLWGLCWFIDAAIFFFALRRTQIVQPLFEISAGRSGSTQLAHYLEDDERIAAPTTLQVMFPFVWMWKLARHTIGRLVSEDRIRAIVHRSLPPAFLQRHELDPFRTDTFEVCMYSRHFIEYSLVLGPDMMLRDFSPRVVEPHNRQQDFVEFIDAIGRKTLYHAGLPPDGSPKRLMIKGHFLASAPALESRYPDACFLTMIREPAPRLQSGINFLRVGPTPLGIGPPPWNWLARFFVEAETEYCQREMEWYQETRGAKKCVLRFQDYIRDLEGAMRQVYRECFDSPDLPPHVPTVHEPRQRTNYLVDRSLAQLGIDAPALNARLIKYIDWCRGTAVPQGEVKTPG